MSFCLAVVFFFCESWSVAWAQVQLIKQNGQLVSANNLIPNPAARL